MNTANEVYSVLYGYLDALWRKRYLIAIILVVMPVLGLIAGIMVPKKYEASTSLATFKTAPPSMKELVYIPDISEQFAGISAFLTSSATLQRVLLQAGIVSPDTDIKTVEELANELSKQLTITLVEKTVVEIKITGSNQKNMLAILKSLSDLVITEFLTPLATSTQSAETFLKKQVEFQRGKLNDSIKELSEYEAKHSSYLPKYSPIYTARLGQIINDLGATETEYNTALAEKKWLENTLSNINPAIIRIEKSIADNEAKLNKMRAIYTDNYPGIQASLELAKSLKAERDKLNEQSPRIEESKLQKLLDTELYSPEKINSSDKSGSSISTKLKDYQDLEQKIKGLSGRVEELNAQKKELSYTLSQIDSTEKTVSFLLKAVRENQQSYEDFLKRYDMTRMTMQLTHIDKFSPIKIVASPKGPLTNIARPVIFYPIVALFGGIFLSFGLVLMIEFLDNTVRRKHVVEALVGSLVISRVEKMNIK